ncbi:RNA-binding protein [Mycoplasma nasistruthionis]|uniref:RNA-binding protein n=1 Tax=Mycoplasma nasistruthionis TaxID=353852 RepID=A0A4Y6I6A6_9MOLU|nr:RNA-binding protein [Mycoplasma nasistruthionis]QCZ36590.1 RNA-binding protein [Mycoplasma nasistruthionis]QDF64891.1 RNA-binding protein [Mycoplasma nasistruthionis]
MNEKKVYKVGEVASAKVIKTGSKFAVVMNKFKTKFVIYKNEVSDFNKNKVNEVLKVGDYINFIVLHFDKSKNHGIGSFKQNHPNYLNKQQTKTKSKKKAPLKLQETANGFNNLIKHTIESVLLDAKALEKCHESNQNN